MTVKCDFCGADIEINYDPPKGLAKWCGNCELPGQPKPLETDEQDVH